MKAQLFKDATSMAKVLLGFVTDALTLVPVSNARLDWALKFTQNSPNWFSTPDTKKNLFIKTQTLASNKLHEFSSHYKRKSDKGHIFFIFLSFSSILIGSLEV